MTTEFAEAKEALRAEPDNDKVRRRYEKARDRVTMAREASREHETRTHIRAESIAATATVNEPVGED